MSAKREAEQVEETLKEDKKHLQMELKNKESKLGLIEADLEEKTSRVNSLNIKITKLTDEVEAEKTLKEEKKHLEMELKKQESKLALLETDLEEKASNNKALNIKLTKLTDEVEAEKALNENKQKGKIINLLNYVSKFLKNLIRCIVTNIT